MTRSLSPREELAAAAIEESIETIERYRSDQSFRVPTPPISSPAMPPLPTTPPSDSVRPDLTTSQSKTTGVVTVKQDTRKRKGGSLTEHKSVYDLCEEINRGIAKLHEKHMLILPATSSKEAPSATDSRLPRPLTVGTSVRPAQHIDDVKWQKWFQELQEYEKVHGDCNVPRSRRKTHIHQKLGMWVQRQRSMYSLRKAGRQSSMTDERIKALESIGFCWRITSPRAARKSWEDRLEEVKQYKKSTAIAMCR